jgi:hypothetical protein
MADAHTGQTYHGVPIPEEHALSWPGYDPEAIAWRQGVRAALRVTEAADEAERDRLEPVFRAADAEDQAVWQAGIDEKLRMIEERKNG